MSRKNSVKPVVTDLVIFGTDEQAISELQDIDTIIESDDSKIKENLITAHIQEVDNNELLRQISWMHMKKLLSQIDGTAFPKGTAFWCDYDTVTVRIDWGTELLSKARKVMGKGWKFDYKSDASDGSITYHYSQWVTIPGIDSLRNWRNDDQKNFSLRIVMQADKLRQGTCTKVLVEEREVTYKHQVYKVVCDGVAQGDEVQ